MRYRIAVFETTGKSLHTTHTMLVPEIPVNEAISLAQEFSTVNGASAWIFETNTRGEAVRKVHETEVFYR